MKKTLRVTGSLLVLAGIAFLAVSLVQRRAVLTSGDLTCNFQVREKLITGAYKVYGLKDSAVGLWLAKSVFKNDTSGPVKDLRVRYKLGEYADWCSWQEYPLLVPTETVVDLYYPILSSKCAQLTSRSPEELLMQYEYVNAAGEKKQVQKAARLTMLGRREFYFTDLKPEEMSGSFQDLSTYSHLLAAWVTSADMPVAGLASLANKRAGGVGASGSDKECFAALRECYEIMRDIKITYQHPASLMDPGQSYDPVLIQSLQYPRDTIEKRSGTCIDLAILYAAMLNSIGITPVLVSKDNHCFPMAVAPEGGYIPVETTGVGGGPGKSSDFAKANKIALQEWDEVRKTGRFTIVKCREGWAAGIAPAELDPLPADILERWNIREAELKKLAPEQAAPDANAREQAASNANAREQAAPNTNAREQATPNANVPDTPPPQQPSVQMAQGDWTCVITPQSGMSAQATARVAVSGTQIQMVFSSQYQITGANGRRHQAQQQSTYTGTINGQALTAQCSQAVWYLDGSYVQPQGLPFTLRLTIGPDGRSAQGMVMNAAGRNSQVLMQAK